MLGKGHYYVGQALHPEGVFQPAIIWTGWKARPTTENIRRMLQHAALPQYGRAGKPVLRLATV